MAGSIFLSHKKKKKKVGRLSLGFQFPDIIGRLCRDSYCNGMDTTLGGGVSIGEAKGGSNGENLKLGECNHRSAQYWRFLWRGKKVGRTQKNVGHRNLMKFC